MFKISLGHDSYYAASPMSKPYDSGIYEDELREYAYGETIEELRGALEYFACENDLYLREETYEEFLADEEVEDSAEARADWMESCPLLNKGMVEVFEEAQEKKGPYLITLSRAHTDDDYSFDLTVGGLAIALRIAEDYADLVPHEDRESLKVEEVASIEIDDGFFKGEFYTEGRIFEEHDKFLPFAVRDGMFFSSATAAPVPLDQVLIVSATPDYHLEHTVERKFLSDWFGSHNASIVMRPSYFPCEVNNPRELDNHVNYLIVNHAKDTEEARVAFRAGEENAAKLRDMIIAAHRARHEASLARGPKWATA